MTYDVLVRHDPGGYYEATVLGWPACTVTHTGSSSVYGTSLLSRVLVIERRNVAGTSPEIVNSPLSFVSAWATL